VPAAAVIPAPIAYAKVVAVKKLVVGLNLYEETEAGNTADVDNDKRGHSVERSSG
jgi:hypothetical protein